MAQPATLFLARELTRVIPFTSQGTNRTVNLANAATIVFAFDIALKTTDRNQLIGGISGAPPSGDPTRFAIGTLLDVVAFSAGAGTITVEFAVDSTCSYRALPSIAVPISTEVNIAGLRITGRYVRVTYTNTSGGVATTEFGAYVRSQ